MADLLQITQPLPPQNYNPQLKPPQQGDSIFDLVDLSKVIKPSDRSDQNQDNTATGEGAKTPLKLPMMVSKDPQFAATLLKGLLSGETLAGLMDSVKGNPELLQKLTEFANEIMLTPEQLLSDLLTQGEESTLFKGSFFDMLRNLNQFASSPRAGTQGADLKNAIAQLLKATVSASQGADILKSVSGNLRFLAQQMYQSRQLSASLEQLAGKFLTLSMSQKNGLPQAEGQESLAELRQMLQTLMGDVNNSLLATDSIKSFGSLITHTLSRYSGHEGTLKDAFQSLMGMLSGGDAKDALREAFQQYVITSGLPSGVKSSLVNMPEDGFGKLALTLSFLANREAASLDPANLTQRLDALLKGAQSGFGNTKDLSTQSMADSLMGGDSVLTAGNNSSYFNVLKSLLKEVLPPSARSGVDQLMSGFEGDRNLNKLLDHLSTILNNITSMEIKVPLGRALNYVLGEMAKEDSIQYKPPTSMENLVNFLSKNINDAALKSLGGFHEQELAASMLSAPGVFTPLLHYLVPLQVDGLMAFGELWVDPDDSRGHSDEEGEDIPSNHLFLTFSVENVGDFELEVLARKNELAISLLCPVGMSGTFEKTKSFIARIAANKGYKLQIARVEPLKRKRTLLDVFPQIKEKRGGLNAVV